jgi:putative heme-binding domain-containing protein
MRSFLSLSLTIILLGAAVPTIHAQTPVYPKELEYRPELVEQIVADALANGDARRGAIVFSLPTSACSSCHKIAERGGDVGPELTKVGTCLKPAEIVEAVYWPNRTVKDDYRAVAVTTTAGRLVQGVVRKDTGHSLMLIDAAGKSHTVAKTDIEERREIGSLMPPGLLSTMSPGERRDLVRYLLELGKSKGLDAITHAPAAFAFDRTPLHPECWPNAGLRVNRDRIYDYYTRQAMHFKKQRPLPPLLPEWPGLDGGKFGHWGNQNESVWADDRWNKTDLGSLLCGVVHTGNAVIPRGVCVRLGDAGEMSACFNPETLQLEALWTDGFVRFSDVRHGFMGGLRPAGKMLASPPAEKVDRPFVYHGFYRHGKRVVFAYRVGGIEMLDAPWVEAGKFVREIAPANQHSLKHVLSGGPAQWPKALTTSGTLGKGRPYAIDTIAPPFENPWNALLFFSGHDFFRDGSAAICTMQGDVWHVSGIDETLANVRWRRIASGLHQPLGLVIASDVVYIQGRDQITRLVDRNGDGEADFYQCFSKAFSTSAGGHDFICGLERDPAGHFYTASSNQGLIRISPDGAKVDVLATGFRNPDGLGLLPGGVLTVPASEGEWTPASMICEVRSDSKRVPHFGYGGPRGKMLPDLPLVYLPRGIDNSAGGQVYVNSDRWGPLRGQLVHLSFGAASHALVLRDEVDGQPQGAVVPLVGDFRSGVHRGRFHPLDGQLYVSGMNGWGTYAGFDGCFQRVRFTGGPVDVPIRIRVHRNGVLLTFPEPLDKKHVERVENHFAQAWNYRYGPGYGSREYSPSHYGLPGHDALTIASAVVLSDSRSLFLELPELQPVNQLHLHIGLGAGRTTDVFATVHKLAAPFTDIPNYREVTRPLGVHPTARDIVSAQKSLPNPWAKPIAGARDISIDAGKNLTFATARIEVKPGEAIKLTFRNPDAVPHNWVLVKPGTLQNVGQLANMLIADADAPVRHYVPKTDDVVVHTDVVNPGQTHAIYFRAPAAKGRYPYLCTFPGHWMVMNGEMIVGE